MQVDSCINRLYRNSKLFVKFHWCIDWLSVMMKHTPLFLGTVTQLVDEITQKGHRMVPCYLRCKKQADPSEELRMFTDKLVSQIPP